MFNYWQIRVGWAIHIRGDQLEPARNFGQAETVGATILSKELDGTGFRLELRFSPGGEEVKTKKLPMSTTFAEW